MKYIYLKGLINNKRFILMTLTLFILLICLFFLFGYTNIVKRKIYDVELEKDNRTIYFYSSSFDVSKFTDVLEDYVNQDNFYTLVFINYDESQKFIKDNSNKVDISEHVLGYNEKTLYFWRLLNISAYVLSILFFIVMIVFHIHFISSSNKVIKLYFILGLPIKRIIYIFNGLFGLFYILVSISIYLLINYIKPNLLVIESLIIIIIVLILSSIMTSIIINRLYLSKRKYMNKKLKHEH